MHKVQSRATIKTRLLDGDLSEALESALFGGGDGFSMLLDMVERGKVDLGIVLNYLGSRLHRNVPSYGLQRMSMILVTILTIAPAAEDIVYLIVRTFPDLLPTLSQTMLLEEKGAFSQFLRNGLEEWVQMPLFSHQITTLELKRCISVILRNVADADSLPLVVAFIRNLNSAPEHIPEVLLLVQQLLSGLCITGDANLSIAVLEFAYSCKRAVPEMDTSNLLKLIGKIECPYSSLLAAICSCPLFTENEIVTILRLSPESQSDPATQLAALFALSDYPFLGEENEKVINNILELPTCDAVVDISGEIHDSFVLLMSVSISSPEPSPATQDWQDFDVAYSAFFHSAMAILKSPTKMLLEQLVAITEFHPILAQRLLLLVSLCLKNPPSRDFFVDTVQCLLRISDIDDFCRERASTLLRSLCGSSLAIQQVVLPLIARQLHKYQRLANSVMSNIPSLVYSENATASSVAAYAVTISTLAKMVHKRTYMDFAFSSIRMWNEIVKPALLVDTKSLGNNDYNSALCNLVSTLSSRIPPDLEVYDSVEPVIMEGFQFLVENVLVNPAASLEALLQFPTGLLTSHNVDLMQIFMKTCSTEIFDEDAMCRFLGSWIAQEINQMPKSLFLGTSSMKSGKATAKKPSPVDAKITALWSTNPIYAAKKIVACGSMKELSVVLGQLPALPSLTMQHWLLRLEFFSLLWKGIHQVLMATSDHAEFAQVEGDLSAMLLARLGQGQSVASVSYALIAWAALAAASTFIDANHSRARDALQMVLGGEMVPERFQTNEEVFAIRTVAVRLLFDTLEDSHQRSFQNQVTLFLSTLKPAENSWLWLVYEYSFGTKWPSTIRSEKASQSGLEPMFSTPNWSLAEFQSLVEDTELRVKSEPAGLAGMTLYGLGRAACRTIPKPQEWINGLLNGLLSPGPAIKKTEHCYALAGLVGIGSDAVTGHSELEEPLTKALGATTDARLQTWLVVLLHRVLAGSSTAVSPIGEKSLNRFGSDSLFGCCLDILISHPKFSDTILAAFCNQSVLPLLDWSWLPTTPAGLQLAWKHFQSGSPGQQSHRVNKSLIQILANSIEDEQSIIESGKLTKLIEAIGPDSDTANRILIAQSLQLRNDETLLNALMASDTFVFDQDLLVNLLETCNISASSWKMIAEKKIQVPGASELLKFLATSDLDDAIEACPAWTFVVSTIISANDIANLISAYIMRPDDADKIVELIMQSLRHRAHPFTRLANGMTRDRLRRVRIQREKSSVKAPVPSTRTKSELDSLELFKCLEEDITSERIFDAIKLSNSKDANGKDIMVPSLIPGVEISLENLFKSLVCAMNVNQKERLLCQWSETPLKRLKNGGIQLVFTTIDNRSVCPETFYFVTEALEKLKMTVEDDPNGDFNAPELNQEVKKIEGDVSGNTNSNVPLVPAIEFKKRRAVGPKQPNNIPEDGSWNTLTPGVSAERASQTKSPDLVPRPDSELISFVKRVTKIQSRILCVPLVGPFDHKGAANSSPVYIRTVPSLSTIFVPKVDSMRMLMGFVYWLN
ncbi:hypothetical protein PSACC_01037 [Paramicrosporidium saccamoebae]|uniref:Uncharacterized protein n=1 Tax=Paramicrosporidium saccamoebae TaxID=1246581 RepID=A0A2H9TN39_9FUNG|nr:hypothetical protein PSACC_01037 [Paramicrosporidium saccamoebae]